MRRIFTTTLMVSIVSALVAQNNISASLGAGTFVEGLSPVNNIITISNVTFGTDSIHFVATDPTWQTTYAGYTDNNSADGFEWIVDMGQFPPGTVIWGYSYDNGNPPVVLNNTFPLDILPKPAWMNSTFLGTATVTNVDVAQKTVSFTAGLDLKAKFDDVIPNAIKGLKGKVLKITPNLSVEGVYDIPSHTTQTPNDPIVSTDIDFVVGSKNFQLPVTGSVSFDNNFNPVITATAVLDFGEFSRSLPIGKIPVFGPVCISLDARFSIQPKLKGQVVVGLDGSGDWGFIGNNQDTTQLLAKLTARASFNGSVQALCGMKLSTVAEGSLILQANIGGGANYTSANGLSPVFGGDFGVLGTLSFPWPFKKYGVTDYQLYGPVGFGDTSQLSFKTASSYDDFFGFSSSTSRSLTNQATPNAWPFGSMATKDSALALAWIDDVNTGEGNAQLLLAYRDPLTNSFTQPAIIEANDNGIHNLSVAMLPSNYTLLSWAQSRYHDLDIDTTTTSMDEVISSQDVWVALYDPQSNQTIYKGRIADTDSSTSTSGRAESNPKITWSDATKGLLTWEVADASGIGSDIYFSEITDNGSVIITSPMSLTSALNGFNHSPQVAYYNGNNAMAIWVNDPDADDTTENSLVYESMWNGNNWATPTPHFSLPAGTEVKEVSLATNGSYGVEAFTYEGYNGTDSNLVNGIAIGEWDNSNPNSVQYNSYSDEMLYYQLPKVSVSKNGIASLIMQTRDVTDPLDEGSLKMYLKDLPNAGSWTEVSETANATDLKYLNDTLNAVWQMNNVFGFYGVNGSNDIVYLLTQEMDSSGNTNVSYGNIIGNPNLNVVLRAFEVSSNSGVISLQDVQEPQDTAIYNYYQQLSPFSDYFVLKQNYPNPFDENTKIEFHLAQSANVQLEIFDNIGTNLGSLLSQSLTPGDYSTTFSSGNLPNGIYHYRLVVNGQGTTKHMIISK